MSEALPIILIILLAATVMLLVARRLRAGVHYALRPLTGYRVLGEQIGRAVESGSQLHITLGRAPLPGINGPTSAAGLEILSHLARESSESGIAPRITVGDATLLPAAQGELYRIQNRVEAIGEYAVDDVQFLASNDYPMAYAAGITNTLHHDVVASNIAVGRFGTEVAIIAEAARREQYNQIIGTDDPTAMALATLYTDNVLWGEELFTAGAYLEGRIAQLASVRAQDILRWLVAAGILLFTLLRIGRIL